MTIDIEGPPLRKFDFNVAYKEWSSEKRRAKTWTICLYLCFKNSVCYKHLTYSVKETMEWNCFTLTLLFSVCYKFENMLKVYIYLNCALDSKFSHCLGVKVLDLA